MTIVDLSSMLKRNMKLYVLIFLGGVCSYLAVLLGRDVAPVYLWLLAPGAGLGLLAYLEYRRLERDKLLSRLRQEWGTAELERDRNFADIRSLFDCADQVSTVIDDRTWHDLNMDTVFSRMDRTFTWPGAQRLYQMLRTPMTDELETIAARSRMISALEKDSRLREDIQVILSRMDARIGSGLALLLWENPRVPLIHSPWLYRIMTILALLSPLLLFVSPRYITVVLLVFQVNMYLHFNVQKRIRAYFEGVRSLRQLINTSRKLRSLQYEPLDDVLRKIKESLQTVQEFSKIVRYVGVESTDPFAHMFQQYFTIFFLAEVRGFYRALDFIEANRSAIQELFLALGEIDALQSVASYRVSLQEYCEPSFVTERCLELDEAYHPLLRDPVANSIKIGDKGIMITGSNMSGKSTFLRTVGLNVLMAQTIGTCTSRSYSACPMRLLSSIGRSDNVVEGKSYYMEEALSVLRILDAVDSETVTLVIFDELYRGTNSEERIFAAQRVLEYLVCRNSLVLVATHDLELTSLLGDQYTSFHFSERVSDLGLEFDYKLKKGPATTRNAIALLRYLGYPEEITKQQMS